MALKLTEQIKSFFVLLIFCFIFQNIAISQIHQQHWINSNLQNVRTENKEEILTWLSKEYLSNNQVLKFSFQKTSKSAIHYYFSIEIDGVKLVNHEIQFSKFNSGQGLVQLNQTNIDFSDLKYPKKNLNSIVEKYIQVNNLQPTKLNFMPVWFQQNENTVAAIQVNYTSKNDVFRKLILDFEGNELQNIDGNKYFGNQKDTVVEANVFNPDPLTTSKSIYGDSTTDNNDLNNAFLQNQLKTVSFLTKHHPSKGFYPENQFVKITAHSSPITDTTYGIADLKFNRSQSGFEDVNVVYHITTFKNYINNLGFDSLVNYQIQVDAHGFNGQDQSAFTSFNNPPRLTFGTGGVDDAEDADVIIHEYGHALAHSAAPNTDSGTERAAMEEAIGDYFAASYSRSIEEFDWFKVFSWDGHNEFWPGRMAQTNKMYPTDLKFNLYTDAEIWSSALMEIWENIGREQADELVLESLYFFAKNQTMSNMAAIIYNLDYELNQGINQAIICDIFKRRGFLTICTSAVETKLTSIANELKIINISNGFEIYNLSYQLKSINLLSIEGKLIEQFSLNSNSAKIIYLKPGFYLISDSMGLTVEKLVVKP